MNLLFLSSFLFLSAVSASESMISSKKEVPQSATSSSSSVSETPETSSDFAAEAKISSDFAQETRTSTEYLVQMKPSSVKKIEKAEGEIPLPPDFEMKNDNISEKYFAGAFLIYDCEEKHWVCVLEEDYKGCEDKRKESVEKKERQLSCAPIGEFPTKRSCFQRQLYMAGHAHGYRFCLLDEIKKEELE